MSITPTSDIVLDVARAADPARSAAATARLARIAKGEQVSSPGFAEVAEAERVGPLESHMSSVAAPDVGMRTIQRAGARSQAIKGVEQLVLQKLVEAMLPKETGVLFGRGTAGDMWRSMLAEQLAAQIGAVVDLGMGHALPWLPRDESTSSVHDRHDGQSEAPVAGSTAARGRDG